LKQLSTTALMFFKRKKMTELVKEEAKKVTHMQRTDGAFY